MMKYMPMILALVLFLAAGAVFIYRDEMPWAVSACKAYEPCKVQFGKFETMMIPVPVTATPGAIASRTTVLGETGQEAIKVNVPVNSSATTATDGQPLPVTPLVSATDPLTR